MININLLINGMSQLTDFGLSPLLCFLINESKHKQIFHSSPGPGETFHCRFTLFFIIISEFQK